jgi:hypothetical protein
VPDRDDEKFEMYLKGFRPLIPDALPVRERSMARRPRRWLVVTAAVASVIAGVITFRMLRQRSSSEPRHFTSVQIFAPARPLTLREANALLETAPSYKSAMDELVFPRQSSTVQNQNQSALAVLAKEKIKL